MKLKEVIKLKKFLKAVADGNRLRIICLLAQGERCVCEIFKALNLPQNLTSHHLAKLRDLKLVNERREGAFIFYSLNEKEIKMKISLFNNIIK